MDPHPSTWRGRSEQISLDQVGCEARTIPAEGDVFFLDFSFYRTYQAQQSQIILYGHKPQLIVWRNLDSEEIVLWPCSIQVSRPRPAGPTTLYGPSFVPDERLIFSQAPKPNSG